MSVREAIKGGTPLDIVRRVENDSFPLEHVVRSGRKEEGNMKMKWCLAVVFAILGVALISGPAAAQVTTCNGGTFTVPGDAADLPNGYLNTSCNLIIQTSLHPAISDWKLVAGSIKIDGEDVNNPGNPIEIFGFGGSSKVAIQALRNPCAAAADCSLTIDNADIRANASLLLECRPAICVTDIKLSTLIASQDQQFGSPNGNLTILGGSTDVQTTNVWGGAILIVRSTSGNLVWKCIGGVTSNCVTDPFVAPFTPGVKFFCGDPPVFPCPALGTATAAELSAQKICDTGVVGVQCGGGRVQADILAAGDLDISGSTKNFQGIVQILAGGVIKCSNADIETTGSTMTVTAQNKNNELLAFDCDGAKFTSANNLRFQASKCGGILSDICMDFENAELIAKKVVAFPNINGDNVPPYGNNVLDEAGAECGGNPATVDKGQLTMVTPGQNRRILVCGALLN